MRFLFGAALLCACGGRAQQPQLIDQSHHGVPAIDEDGDRRYVTEKRDGLVEVAPSGARQPIASPPIHWCAIDDKVRVVWFTSSDGLSVFDLDDRELYAITLGDVEDVVIDIDHGNERSSVTELTLVVEVSDTPALHVVLPVDASPELRARREQLASLTLQDPMYLASLHARGAASSYRMRSCE